MQCGDNIESLIDALYPGIAQINPVQDNDDYFQEHTILSARNDDVDSVNQSVLEKFPGHEFTSFSVDTMQNEQGVDVSNQQYPTEFLNSINASGMPLAKLHLKKGVPLMTLQNMDPANGICNGTLTDPMTVSLVHTSVAIPHHVP